MSWRVLTLAFAPLLVACGQPPTPTAPVVAPGHAVALADSSDAITNSEEPPFDLEAVLRGDGFGLVKFRQQRDAAANVINLDVWVRNLLPETSYSLQRAVDTALDGACTGSNWLTLGKGPTPASIVTDGTGSARAELWRDLSTLAPGTAFDIYFRVIEDATHHVALESGCYRFVVRD